MMIERYRLPMFLPTLPQDTTSAIALSHQIVLSRRVSCLQTVPYTLCLTKTGQLAVATPTPLTSARQLELVSLAPIPPSWTSLRQSRRGPGTAKASQDCVARPCASHQETEMRWCRHLSRTMSTARKFGMMVDGGPGDDAGGVH